MDSFSTPRGLSFLKFGLEQVFESPGSGTAIEKAIALCIFTSTAPTNWYLVAPTVDRPVPDSYVRLLIQALPGNIDRIIKGEEVVLPELVEAPVTTWRVSRDSFRTKAKLKAAQFTEKQHKLRKQLGEEIHCTICGDIFDPEGPKDRKCERCQGVKAPVDHKFCRCCGERFEREGADHPSWATVAYAPECLVRRNERRLAAGVAISSKGRFEELKGV